MLIGSEFDAPLIRKRIFCLQVVKAGMKKPDAVPPILSVHHRAGSNKRAQRWQIRDVKENSLLELGWQSHKVNVAKSPRVGR